jgi:ATP-dependent helicase/nuclease subunit B
VKNQSLYNLDGGIPFARNLVAWALEEYASQPERLSRMLILLPSRRSIRTLQDAFSGQAEGRALLLPQMEGIGDIELPLILRHARLSKEQLESLQAIPTAVTPIKRLWWLSELVWEHRHHGVQSLTRMSQAMELARSLASFLDMMQREQCEWQALDNLVPDDYAEQWQHILDFLKVIRADWPEKLKQQAVTDPWVRRNRLLSVLADAWQQQPPDDPVIAAGSTGSVPATANLLKVIASLPQGKLILPGLEASCELEDLPESHPQFGLQQLLQQMGSAVHAVQQFPLLYPTEKQGDASALAARKEWFSLAFLPAQATADWHKATLDSAKAVKDCYYLTCDNTAHEAATIALLLREALEDKEKTAALVTPNRTLARYVRSHLQRWDIHIDDSAGQPLLKTPAAVFLLLLWEAAYQPDSAVGMLSLMKHPLMLLGRKAGVIRPLVRKIERLALRKNYHVTPDSIRTLLSGEVECLAFYEQYQQAIAPLLALCEDPWKAEGVEFKHLLQTHLQVAEQLSCNAEQNVQLWEGEAGEQLLKLLADMVEHTPPGYRLAAHDYQQMLQVMIGTAIFRSAWRGHPRLHILSPLEARLQYYDRVILADLNEGGWPAQAEEDPWLSRSMKHSLELPTQARKTGLMAHDLCQLAAMPELFLTRAEKDEGTMTVPSPFLLRLQAVLEIQGDEQSQQAWKGHPATGWAKSLNHVAGQKPIASERPAPCPPLAARPRRLSVTALEKLMRDPYSIYARYILRLKPLDALQPVIGPAEFGEVVHSALEAWIQQPHRDQQTLLEIGRKQFSPFHHSPVVTTLWWERFQQIAAWVTVQEQGNMTLAEVKGEWCFELPAGPFRLQARTDRIDQSAEGFRVIDYKTGKAPKKKEMALGLANQLLLAALIASHGGFGESLRQVPLVALEYWELPSGKRAGAKVSVPLEGEDALKDVQIKLMELLARFDIPTTPYMALPDSQYILRYHDYAHLARVSEWSSDEESS